MATVILNHRVKDFQSWKALYEQDRPRRAAAGIEEVTVGERNDDPGMVYLIWQMEDTTPLNAMIQDPELQRVMKEAGVISQPEFFILN